MSISDLTEDEFKVLAEIFNAIFQSDAPTIAINYTNYRGISRNRKLDPVRLWFGSTDWHSEPCLLLNALDVQKGEFRDFKVSDFDIQTLEIKTTFTGKGM